MSVYGVVIAIQIRSPRSIPHWDRHKAYLRTHSTASKGESRVRGSISSGIGFYSFALRYWDDWQLTEKLPALPQHAGVVKKAFPHTSFERIGQPPIAVQVSKPFSVLRIVEMAITPIVNLTMPICILGSTSH